MSGYKFPYIEADKYSCWCSGGADSSLLLYYLLKSGKPVDVYTTVKNETAAKNSYTIREVVLKCMELTNNYQVTQIIHYSPEKDEKSLLKNSVKYFNNKMIDQLYTGITANPPIDAIGFYSGQEEIRDPNVTRSVVVNPYVITPFTNYDKKWIAARYEEEGLMNTLFPVTNSCEAWTMNFNQIGIHCGECWWCKEREWGFGHV